MRLRPPFRLSWKLSLAILPPVVLAIAGIVWIQYALARRQILGAINKEMAQIAERTAGGLDELLDQRYRDLFTLSETPLIADYYRNVDFQLLDEAASYRKELQGYLSRFAERSGAYAGILYMDARGRPVCRVGAAAGLPPADFALAARRTGTGFWVSSVEELPGAGPVVYYAKPVRNELGELKGMLALAYDLRDLRLALGGVAVGPRGRAYLKTPDGRLLAATPPESGADSEPRLAAAGAMRRRPWTVVIEAPAEDFLGPLRTVKNAAIATSFAGLALLVAILLWLVRSITRPIAALVAAAERIGTGDFGYRIRDVGRDEIGSLAGAFNEMVGRIDEDRRQNAELQTQLIQAEKLSAVGQLVSAVSHELRNPLAAIRGYLEIALEGSLPALLREDLEQAFVSVGRCAKVVDNLLFFGRRSRQERRRVDLNRAVASALELLGYRLEKTEDVLVVKELAAVSPEIAGDFQQIVQVLVNLIGNACDAMRGVLRHTEGKRLVLRTGEREGRPFVEIEDNGAGIPAEARDKVFEPFFTTKEAGQGTGLGLSICRQIVGAHGGEIAFRSRPGGGTVFRVELPPASAADLEKTPPPRALEEPPPAPGRRVLVADDERPLADLIARLLCEDGDEVAVAYRGDEALRLLEERDYDLVVTDMGMEGARGSDLFAALAARDPRAAERMLFVTGDMLNAKVINFLSEVGVEYLIKPFDVGELRRAARRLLARRPAPARD